MKFIGVCWLVLSCVLMPLYGFAGCVADAGAIVQASPPHDCGGGRQSGMICPQPCKHCLNCVDHRGEPPLNTHALSAIPSRQRPATPDIASFLPSQPYFELLRPPRA
ncbi:MAG: hypothetical protein H6970_11380 [Gammaproteobacteria bacterium]|nr:hypothetical protein [Gammaproteobacteria bacterium]MCP5425651.1 hypothetical protein [Gammaproteobacteria bacterium]